MLHDVLVQNLLVKPGTKAKLSKRDSAWAFDEIDHDQAKKEAAESLERDLAELAKAQDLLYGNASRSILIVLQAMDAAGKDGTIKHVMSGVNPQGCRVWSFKQPSAEEKSHNFLWRYSRLLPERGMIGIFNRSYYEEVLVVRVHPEFLGVDETPAKKNGSAFWKARFEDINSFERHLTRTGTTILKFFLHISKKEQKKRLLERLDDPAKHWKFSANDLAERARWSEYMDAFEEALTATSTEWAPWYVVPADHKWVTRTVVADILTQTIRGFDLRYPELPPDKEAALEVARKKLEDE
jgi:PPK2 family polyphosphate:nucleotide phosphotransferase